MLEWTGSDGLFGLSQATPMYGLRPRGGATGDIESLYSYFLWLSHEHRLTAKKVVADCLPAIAEGLPRLSNWKYGWGWDKNAGKAFISAGQVSSRWADLLAAATGQAGLERSTLNPLGRLVWGELSTDDERICLHCLKADADARVQPYGRLLWRMRAVGCCPIHKCDLVKPVCGRPAGSSGKTFRVKLSGSCSTCGSIAHRCTTTAHSEAGVVELWRAEQCRQAIASFQDIASADTRAAARAVKEYCAQPGSQTSLALRSGLAPSTLSRWLNETEARLAFDQLLDLCFSEGLQLAALLAGRVERCVTPAAHALPPRQKRSNVPVDHFAVRQALRDALENNESVTQVAQRLRVDVSTLARHRDLYDQVRRATRERKAAEDAQRHRKIIEEAESVAMRLIGSNKRLTRRNASFVRSGVSLQLSHAVQPETTAAVLALMRIGLGDRTTRYPAMARRMGTDFLNGIDEAVQRIKRAAGDRQGRLTLYEIDRAKSDEGCVVNR